MTDEDWAIIRSATLFNGAPMSDIAAIVGEQQPSTYEKEEVICAQGDVAGSCFLLLDGLVKMQRKREDGSEATLSIQGPGRSLLLAEALNGEAVSVTAQAATRSRILALDAGRLRKAIETDRKLARTMLAAAALHLRALVAHVEELKTRTALVHLADFILDLSGARSGSVEVSLPYEKQLIAGRLGMTPESFSRALGQLGSHGVRVKRDKIFIHDIAALRAFVS